MKKIYQSPRIDVVQLGGKGEVCDDSVIVFYSRVGPGVAGAKQMDLGMEEDEENFDKNPWKN